MWEKIDDDDAPTWRCGTVGEDWHANDVTVPCLPYDFGYGLANAADANFTLSTNLPDGENRNASTGTHPTICDPRRPLTAPASSRPSPASTSTRRIRR